MKLCDERIQEHLLSGGRIKRKLKTYEVVIGFDENGFIFDDDGDVYQFGKSDLTTDDWEIVRPEYDWNKIIEDKILCVFYNKIDYTDNPIVGYLTKKTADGFYRNGWHCIWNRCKPFNPADYNIVKDLKEYEK